MFCILGLSAGLYGPALLAITISIRKQTPVENQRFRKLGRGNWQSSGGILEAEDWCTTPWDLAVRRLCICPSCCLRTRPGKDESLSAIRSRSPVQLRLGSRRRSSCDSDESARLDLVITDPPFGGLLHYSELSDFFYVWLRLVLKDKYPENFTAEYTPRPSKSLPIVRASLKIPMPSIKGSSRSAGVRRIAS